MMMPEPQISISSSVIRREVWAAKMPIAPGRPALGDRSMPSMAWRHISQ
jgi:hypothetical protein